MHTRRSDIQRLIGAVAALGIAAALAGPASAQETAVAARSGDIHVDCNGFSFEASDDTAVLKAKCRVSDRNYDKEQTSIDLAPNIGSDNGNLTWGGSHFQRRCNSIGVESDYSSVTLKASCTVDNTSRQDTSLGLSSYLQVDDSGDLEVK